MPLHNLGGGCYKWGDSGHKYCGKGAKEKALRQGRAIEMSKHAKGEISELMEIENQAQDAVEDYLLAKEINEAIASVQVGGPSKDGVSPKHTQTRSQIQCLIFEKAKFTKEEALAWLERRDLGWAVQQFKDNKVKETGFGYYFEQVEMPQGHRFKSVKLGSGVNAVYLVK